MHFIETRGNDGVKTPKVTFSKAILSPSASFGGLYVPETIPILEADFWENSSKLSYQEIAFKIINAFKIDVPNSIIEEALALYGNFDNPKDPAPLIKLDETHLVNELFHGPTRAFKDMALQPFGHILSYLAKTNEKKYLILVATSGDTGPASLESFSQKSGIKVVCLYPDGGTSDVQRLQMITATGKNLKVLGIKGNFDDAQRALKNLLSSEGFQERLKRMNLNLSAANSVNFGRIIFQIIYHIYAYTRAVKQGEIKNGEKVYFTIPSGNFGNALGAYYAKKMGLPVEKILITSNINNILTELFTTGTYNIKERKLLKTTSPAMDILVSSNVERLLFDLFGAKRTKELMQSLNDKSAYSLTKEELSRLRETFDATFADDAYAKATMKKYVEKGYILDPHTATCLKADSLLHKPLKNIICATAEWTKFAPTLFSALQGVERTHPDKVALEGISNALKVPIPSMISDVFQKPVLHKEIVSKDNIESAVIEFLVDFEK